MANKTTGSRPKPKVASGKAPNFNTTSGARYSGSSNTKTPTGSRPMPKVASDKPTFGSVPAKPRYPRATPMGTPKRDAQSNKPRNEGGR